MEERMTRIVPALLLLTALWCPQRASAEVPPCDYPCANPYEATLMGLPRALEVQLPAAVPTREVTLTVFPAREIPAVFWYEHGLVCSLAYHDQTAPLIFVIGGAGARYDAPIMVKLQKVLYQAGFHVLAISSPTHMDFVVNAAADLPGDAEADARDLYRVMTLAYAQVRTKIAVSSFALTGYSLGAFNAAFVAKRDAEEQRFNFTRVLLINPPVSLSGAVSAMDQLLVENIPGGIGNLDAWLRSMLVQLVAPETGQADLSVDFIYNLYRRLPRNDANLKTILGLAFRMIAADMIFTADVMNGGGYIVPTHARLTATTSLTRYAMVAYRTRFVDYFDDVLLPHLQHHEPGLTRQGLLDRLNLRSLEPYLRGADTIGLVHNTDDIMLSPGDIAYLEGVFGPRARIFPCGGHVGNMFHPAVVGAITGFLTGKDF
jgi:hypothetical protein